MLSLLSVVSFSAQKITIASRSEGSRYTLVVPQANEWDFPKKHFLYAAQQFQMLTYNITGVNISIQDDTLPLPTNAILIGMNKYTQQLQPGLNQFQPSEDAFRWIVSGNHIFINGGRRGIVYGVYELFQRYGGVRFYSSWMTVTPKAEKFEIPANYDYYSTPDFYYRESHDPDISGLNAREIASKMRMDSGESQVNYEHGGVDKFGGGAHTIIGLINPGNQFPCWTYPQRYALLENGLRCADQPCLTNPDNINTVCDVLRKTLPVEMNSLFVEISQCDGNDYCHCPQCLAKMKLYGDRTSGLWISFLNTVYERMETIMPQIRPEKPEFYIRTLAYVNSLLPPLNLKVNSHIIIRLCLYKNDNSVPLKIGKYEGSIEFMEALKGWTALSNKVMIWMYIDNDNAAEIIHPSWFQIPEDLKTFKEYNCYGTMFGKVQPLQEYVVNGVSTSIGRLFGDFDRMKAYMNSILTWNTSLRTDDVINDFLRGYYGPKAAPYVRQYLDDAYREILLYPNHEQLPLFIDMGSTYNVYPPLRTKEFFEHGFKLWQRAIEVSKTDSDPRYAYNTQTSAIPHDMSVFLYYKEHPVTADWTPERIRNTPDKMMKKIAQDIPLACPDPVNPDPRSNRLCYLGESSYGSDLNNLQFTKHNKDWFARRYLEFLAKDVKPDILRSGNIVFGSKGGFYCGRGGLLQLNGWNYLNYNTGGFDFNNMPILYALDQANKDNFSTLSNNGASNKYMYNELFYRREWDPTVNNRINLFYEITKEFIPANNGITGVFKLEYKNTKDYPDHKYPQDKVVSTVSTVSCKLDDFATQVAWRTSDGKWMKSKLLDQLEADLVGFKNNAREFVIASPSTHRAMQFRIDRDPESVSIDMNRTSKTFTVYIVFNDPPENFRNVHARITIEPIERIDFDFASMPEKVNEYYKGKELSTEQFDNLDQGFNINQFKLYMGGDDKSYSGRAFISEYKSSSYDILHSNPFLILDPNNTKDGYPHYGETFNFSFHVRCDIVDPNQQAFALAFLSNPHFGVNEKNIREYQWFNLSLKGEDFVRTQRVHLTAFPGASKCYVDKVRFIPIKAAEIPYVPPRIQKFEFHDNLPPMKPVDMYQLYSKPAPQTPTLYPESSQSGDESADSDSVEKSSNAGVIVAVVVIVLAVAVVVGCVVYKKFFANKNNDGSSDVIAAPLV